MSGVGGATVIHTVGHAVAHDGHGDVDTGDSVQAAAVEVLLTQAIEIGMVRAWLTDWGASTATPATAMGWMNRARHVGGVDVGSAAER